MTAACSWPFPPGSEPARRCLPSCFFFLWFAGLNQPLVVILLELLLTGLLMHGARRSPRESLILGERSLPPAPLPVRFPGRHFLAVACLLVVAAAAGHFILKTMASPHGDWDASTIWNFRARCLILGDGQPTRVFDPFFEWSHPDYPVLLPGFIARAWSLLGSMPAWVPQMVGALFTFGAAGVGAGVLRRLRSPVHGMLFALLLLGTPFYIHHGASQYADVPLGFYFLAAIACLALHDAAERHGEQGGGFGCLLLAGFFAAAGLWTKNEGVTFLPLLLGGRCAATLFFDRSLRRALVQGMAMLLGAAPVLATQILFKTTFPVPNEIFLYQLGNTDEEKLAAIFTLLQTPVRYWIVAKTMTVQFFTFGRWWPAGVVAALLLLAPLCGLRRRFPCSRTVLAAGLALAGQLTVYFMVYVITPYGLEWHLRTSLERLFCQLWPAFLFTYLLVLFPALAGEVGAPGGGGSPGGSSGECSGGSFPVGGVRPGHGGAGSGGTGYRRFRDAPPIQRKAPGTSTVELIPAPPPAPPPGAGPTVPYPLPPDATQTKYKFKRRDLPPPGG